MINTPAVSVASFTFTRCVCVCVFVFLHRLFCLCSLIFRIYIFVILIVACPPLLHWDDETAGERLCELGCASQMPYVTDGMRMVVVCMCWHRNVFVKCDRLIQVPSFISSAISRSTPATVEWLVCWTQAQGPGFKSQSRRCQVTVLGKLFTPIAPLFTKQQNW